MPGLMEDGDCLWGMFSTHSSVTQLKPDTVLQCVQEAEEQQWLKGDLDQGSHDLQDGETPSLGSVLLSHSTSLKKIHGYFSQLESRKCCLHLACRRATFNSMRVVPTSTTVDDGSAKSNQEASEVRFLENKDLRAFKHAYLCAVYPVLAAPCPPSPYTPSPILHESGTVYTSSSQRNSSFSSLVDGLSVPPSFSVSPPPTNTSPSSDPIKPRPLTPYSLHDSGVEESEEAAMIPMESICEQLQRAFCLSRAVFHQYEALLTKTYAMKSSQRLLAEELSGQLAVLETNSHPFYAPKHFITQNGYDLWQKQERSHIAELLDKFWHLSLPFPRDSQDLIAELHSVHEDYDILLKKLLLYESHFRESADMSHDATFTPLSSASCRLLLEFGLRYGIGELYRKSLLLQCLASAFSPSVGYLSFINNLVQAIHQMLPSNKTAVVMVKQEFDILNSALRVLKVQTCKALSQMKSLFPGNRPHEGIELLLSLLHSVLGLMGYLAPAHVPQEKFHEMLKSTVESIFKPTYEMFKSVAFDDLDQGREVGSDPRMIHVLIQDIREDVADYKNNFEITFKRFFSISKLAATNLYTYLMEDVEALTQSDIQHKLLVEIDLRMLALAYRLNQLDSDWSMYITPLQQTWRTSFLSSLTLWMSALRSHLQKLVLEAVAGDAFVSKKVDLPHPVLMYQTSSPQFVHHSVSISSMSISPSIYSAFSSIVSSKNPTPCPECTLQGLEALTEDGYQENQSAVQNFGLATEYELRPPKPKKSQWDTISLNGSKDKILHFSAFRRFSLPEKLDEAKSSDQFNINQLSSEAKGDNKVLSKPHVSSNVQPSGQGNLNCQTNHSTAGMLSLESSSDSEASINPEFRTQLESEEEEFNYPPLKIISSKSLLQGHVTDFSKPVFSKPKTPQSVQGMSSKRHLLRVSGSLGLSTQDSGSIPILKEVIVSDYDSVASLEGQDNATCSTEAFIPVSGSAVDMIIMLQRLCYFCSNLVTVILMNRPLVTNTGAKHESFQKQLSQDSTDYETPHNFISSTVSPLRGNVSVCGRQISSYSSVSQQSESIRKHNFNINEKEFIPIAPPASFSPTTDENLQEVNNSFINTPQFEEKKVRFALHLRILKVMCNMLVVYSTNMLCMDLCSTPKMIAKRLVGPKLVEFVESQQMGGLVWGCRHLAEVPHDCLHYLQRNTKYLCDCYEPVTRYMCTRINNVAASLCFLKEYRKKLLRAFNIDEERMKEAHLLFHASDLTSGETDSGTESTSTEYDHVSHQWIHDDDLNVDSLGSSLTNISDNIQPLWVFQSAQAVETTQHHLMSVQTGMCRLLAYKLSLFVKDALRLLLERNPPTVSVETCLAPVTTFLQRYFDSLSTWLYHEHFWRVLENLWVLMAQDLELQAEHLIKTGASANVHAHNWMLAISHLIKFFNNNGNGIKKDLLLAQANTAIFWLQLYTLSTHHLITLYHSLQDYYTDGDSFTLEENSLRSPPAIIHRIHRELQSLRKCFSGAELAHWIMKNKDELPADQALPAEVTRETALGICQNLLDNQFIVEVDSESYTRSSTPVSDMGGLNPYPQLSVHSHAASGSSSPSSVSTIVVVQAELHQADMGSSLLPSSITPTPELKDQESAITTQRGQKLEQTYDVRDERGASPDVTQYGKGIQSQVSSCENRTKDRVRNNVSPAGSMDEMFGSASNKQKQITHPVHQSFSVSDFRSRSAQNIYNVGKRRHSGSDDDLFYEQDRGQTPFSSLVDIMLSGDKTFKASSKKFYLVHQSLLPPGATSASQGKPYPSLLEPEKNFLKLKGSQEMLTLVEKCFIHKITPVIVAAIVAGRKKNDVKAKNFMRNLPKHIVDQVKNMLDEPGLECRSS